MKVRFFKSGLLKDSSLYGLTSIFEKSIPFFLLPILTRFLSTEDYGRVSMFLVLVGVVTPLVSLGVRGAILRSFYKEEIDRASYLTNSIYLIGFSSSILLFLFFCFKEFIATNSGLTPFWVPIIVLVSLCQITINLLLVVWQAESKPLKHGGFKIAFSALNMALSIALIVWYGYNWEGRIGALLISSASFAVFAIFLIIREGFIKPKIVKKYIYHSLSFGVPLIPHLLSGTIIAMSDRFFITNMIGLSETGIYAVGYQIGAIIEVLGISFRTAWVPWLYKQLNSKNEKVKNKIVKFTYVYCVLIFLVALAVSFLAPWLMSFMIGDEFQGSMSFVIWVATGYSFKAMYYVIFNYVTYVEKTYLLSRLTLSIAVLNMIMNYFLIGKFGAIGAAQATTISYLFQFLFVWLIASRVYKMPWFTFY
ncbi:MAG: oligosaccharide flippase family protein [Cyclobacteriaceae bacterium]